MSRPRFKAWSAGATWMDGWSGSRRRMTTSSRFFGLVAVPVVVILLPGLGGSAWSPYATGLANSLSLHGFRVAILHARGCGTQPNRLVTAYHSGQTDDLRFFLEALCVRQSPERVYAVGFSLGANVLLKYLAESPDSPVSHAVAVSPPLDLAACANALKGRKPVLPELPASGLHQMLAEKRLRTDLDALLRIDDSSVAKLRTIEAYDDAITAPLHGFGTKERYYRECSSGPRLAEISAPTTILSSIDDPFLDPTQYDRLPSLPKNVELRLTRYGGHVGFIQRIRPGKGLVSWLDAQILTYFN